MNENPTQQTGEWTRGWPIVLAASTGYGVTGGLFAITAGLFINPMREEFGWSMSQVAFSPYVFLLISLMMPVGGVIIEKVGARPVALFGIGLFLLGYIALVTLPLNLIQLYAIVACLGIFGPSVNAGPYLRVVATWFKRNIGLAFGFTTAGSSFSGIILLPLVAVAIIEFGWRAGYVTMALLLLFVALPILLILFREKPIESAQHNLEQEKSGVTLGQALLTGRFWLLLLAIGFAAIPVGVYLTHLQPLLQSAGFTVATGAAYGSLFAFAIAVGRVGGGLLVDRFWSFGVAAVAIGLGAIGCLLVTSVTPDSPFWLTAISVILIGLAYGGEVDFAGYFSLKLFGIGNFDRIFGLVALVMGVAIAGGGIGGSALFDITNSYNAVGHITAVSFAGSSGAFLLLGLMSRNRVDG